MGKKGKGGGQAAAAEKAAQKAQKRAKQEAKASKTLTKKDAKAKPAGSQQQQQQNGGKGGGGKKGGKKGKAAAAMDDDEDLDALLEKFREQWATEHVVHEEKMAEAPTRRANATLTPCPNGTDLWLFGGEYFDGDRALFYPDLYRYTPSANPTTTAPAAIGAIPTDGGVWRSYASANQPGPRSAHQVATTAANGGQLWLFGGEFAGPRMNSFHHYRDLWVFHVTSRQWERIDTKVRPSARSGHRMVCWKHFLVLFGGFQDTGVRTTYLGDLWVFDLSEYKWHEIKHDALRAHPAARSGFSLLACPDGVLLHGGYCKRYVKGQRTQGVALEDTWFLKLELGADGDLLHSGKVEWQRRRKIGYAPGPRSGCTMALWGNKNMGVLFGGVTDQENDEESLESVCHNELFAYQLSGNGRWVSLNLKRPKKKGGRRRKKPQAQTQHHPQQQQQRRQERQRGDNDTDEEEDNEGRDDDDGLNGEEKHEQEEQEEEEEEEEDDPDDPQKSVPLARFNTMLAVQRNTLYCYGGIHETQSREYTLDDFYTLDLSKMERFQCLKACPIDALEWNESDSESESTSGDSDSDSSGSDSDDEEQEQQQEGEEVNIIQEDEDELFSEGEEGLDDETLARLKREKAEREELRKKAMAFAGVAKDSKQKEQDFLSTPLPGENLKDFYARTKSYWGNKAYEESQGQSRGKEMRRDGFSLADKRYAEYKPMLDEVSPLCSTIASGLDSTFALSCWSDIKIDYRLSEFSGRQGWTLRNSRLSTKVVYPGQGRASTVATVVSGSKQRN